MRHPADPAPCSPSGPTTSGPAFSGTVTVNACVADVFEPPRSVAVTVTTAVPADTGVSRTVEPDTETDATCGADDTAP